MRLNRAIACALGPLLAAPAIAAEPALPPEAAARVVQAVTRYAQAIACPDVRVDPALVAPLHRPAPDEDASAAKFAALWLGDVGCQGGTGTAGAQIAVVTVGASDTYVVDPRQSSPVVAFDSPVRFVERILGHTEDSLQLQGKGYAPKDANCCPTLDLRFTLKADARGNWRLLGKPVGTPAK